MNYYPPIPLMANFIYDLQWFIFANSVFVPRGKRLRTWGVEFALYALNVILGSELPYMSFVRFVYFPFLFTAGFMLIFRDKWHKLALFSLVMYLVTFVTEIVVGMLLYTPDVLAGYLNEQPLSLQLQIYISWTFVSAIQIWAMFLWVKRKELNISLRQWGLCIAFLLCQVGILHGYVREICLDPSRDSTLYFALSIFSCVAMDAFLIQFIISLSREERLSRENKLLLSQIEAQIERGRSISAEYEAVRRMRHDIDKHLSTMEQMLIAENTDEASDYVKNLKQQMEESGVQFCQNTAVDALLHAYAQRAGEKGIKLEISVQIPEKAGVENGDLICAFGNMLDNALEACENAEKGHISIACAQMKGCFVITLENNCPEKGQEKQKHIAELERGMGNRILRHIAEKYQGQYITEKAEDMFRGKLSLMSKERDKIAGNSGM